MNSQSNQSGFSAPASAGNQPPLVQPSLSSGSSGSLDQAQYLLQQPNYLETFNDNISADGSVGGQTSAVYVRNAQEKQGLRSGGAVQQQQSQHQPQGNLVLPSEQIYLQMQQQYENQIRSLQLELSAFRANQMQTGPIGTATTSPATASAATVTAQRKTSASGAAKRSHSTGIVDTYLENITAKEFSCKNCSYRTKSEASLVVHNTNHLVNQRYLHLPTTVFSVQSSTQEAGSSPQAFLYPCGECSGKFPQSDLYLHIYQHHSGESPFHCDECDLFFMHFEFLDDHQRSTHHQKVSGKKKSRYSSNQPVDPSAEPPALTYYSVVKCSKPFSGFHSASTSSAAAAEGTVNSSSWAQDSQTAEMNSALVGGLAYQHYHSSQHKRGRGRGRGGGGGGTVSNR